MAETDPPAATGSEAALDRELGEAFYLGREEAERKYTDRIIDVIRPAIEREAKKGEWPARRDAHAFDTGFVRAKFRVDRDIARHLQRGVFAWPGREYKAWIRFSNGSFMPARHRWSPDARGMAVKLVGVPGAKLLDDGEGSQDFVLISHPRFFVDDLRRYRPTLDRFLRGGFWNQWVCTAVKLRWPRAIWIALRVNVSFPSNPLFFRYWSMTPYRLGDQPYEKIAVKYAVTPPPGSLPPLRRRLRDVIRRGFSLKRAVAATLAEEETYFDFHVQRYVDRYRTPIEDSTVEWPEVLAPLEHVATIVIPRQRVATEPDPFCEDLSFNPWHALPAHQPLGLVNRVRRRVYRAISDYRHALNDATPPDAMEAEWDRRAEADEKVLGSNGPRPSPG